MTQTLPLLQEGLWDAFIALLFMDKLIHAVSFSDSDLNYPFATIPFQACRELVSSLLFSLLIHVLAIQPRLFMKLMNLL